MSTTCRARYEIRANSFNDEIERMIRTREWLFYSARKNLFHHKTRFLTLETEQERNLQQIGSHRLPFSFDLPMKDLSAQLSHPNMVYSSPNWPKPTPLPPTCVSESNNLNSTVKSVKSNLRGLLRSIAKTTPSEIRYYLVVEIHWQRSNILRSNKTE